MLFLYSLLMTALALYSYFLIDPNLTFFQTGWWESFRDFSVYIGYYRRDLSWIFYLVLIIMLFVFHLLIVKKFKKINPLHVALLISVIAIFSYPFLSHDFFNYLFDAKIVTVYHSNPYAYKPLDFPGDQWLRFMHWTHRTYPYGPVFLFISVIPSFLSFGKFVLSFFFFKIFFSIFFLLAVYFLQKINKKSALIFATHPLVIIEGLVSSHNDLIAVSLGIIGIYYLYKNRNKIGWAFLLLSVGIKYLTFPILIVVKKNQAFIRYAFIGIIIILGYFSFRVEIQPWYFLNLFIFISIYEKLLSKFNIFFAGLLLSYYPYIRLGGWVKPENVSLKHWIIAVFFALNILLLLIQYLNNVRHSKKNHKRE